MFSWNLHIKYVDTISRNGFTCPYYNSMILPRIKKKRSAYWLIWKGHNIICVSSALIGWFTGAGLMLNSVSDWLFRCAAQCWALLWLVCFTGLLNVELCSDGACFVVRLNVSSALIGLFVVAAQCWACSDWLFTVRLNVELCSDWLFHSVAQCWALLWLAVSLCGSMLSSALIGCFTVLLNMCELCSDWLFRSAAQCWALRWWLFRSGGSMLELCSKCLLHSMAQPWALLWLAVAQCGSMLSSALIGCYTALLNVELYSDWLFSQHCLMLSSALMAVL